MEQIAGFLLVILAGVFQGLFMLPSTLTKNWRWEHYWMLFAVFGMFVINVIIGFLFLPDLFRIYRFVPFANILFLMLFGMLCGAGSVLFGLAMSKLGMALGYPIIMGVNAAAGALLPLLIFNFGSIVSLKGILVLIGVVLIVLGVIFCGKASSLKDENTHSGTLKNTTHLTGILIAVSAGVLSSAPNLAMVFSRNLINTAIDFGIAEASAGNVVWPLFFTFGAIINVGYCIWLIINNKSARDFVQNFSFRNLLLVLAMSLLWILSLYVYGVSAGKLGNWGTIIGWALFVSLSIVTGNLAGIWRGEWTDSTAKSKRYLNLGLGILIIAVFIISGSNIV